MQLPETEYNPDEKYTHPEPGTNSRIPNESIPSIPTPAQQEQQYKENTKTTVQVPTSLIRWFCYTCLFSFMLIPFAWDYTLTVLQMFSLSAILGQFAGQLNKLIDK